MEKWVKLTEFSLLSLVRLAKKVGVTRVNEEAALLLGEILESIGEQICREAMLSMMLSKRVTLQPEDVKIGAKKVVNHPRERGH